MLISSQKRIKENLHLDTSMIVTNWHLRVCTVGKNLYRTFVPVITSFLLAFENFRFFLFVNFITFKGFFSEISTNVISFYCIFFNGGREQNMIWGQINEAKFGYKTPDALIPPKQKNIMTFNCYSWL